MHLNKSIVAAVLAFSLNVVAQTYPPTTIDNPGSCQDRENACRSAPNANQATCSAERCACDAVPDYCNTSASPSVGVDVPIYTPAPQSCEEKEAACRSAPNGNQATCSAERCACDGVPDYCKTTSQPTPQSCDEEEAACRSAPNGNQATCSAERCACDGKPDYCKTSPSASVDVPVYTPTPESCEDKENKCRTAKNANQAQCSADRCSCDGKPDYCKTSASPSVSVDQPIETPAPSVPVQPSVTVDVPQYTPLPPGTSGGAGSPPSAPTAEAPAPPVYTGAASKANVGALAILGGVAAVLF